MKLTIDVPDWLVEACEERVGHAFGPQMIITALHALCASCDGDEGVPLAEWVAYDGDDLDDPPWSTDRRGSP